MSWRAPERPEWVRALNAGEVPPRREEAELPLERDALLGEARARLGLPDGGADDFGCEEFDAEAAAARIVAAGRPLVEVLLDQRVVCGMGTIWASELAAAAGADPFAVPGAAADLVPALSGIRRRMQRSVAGARQVGPEALRVFERTGRPCRTCGTPIRAGHVGASPMQRPTYWCPTCQGAGSEAS